MANIDKVEQAECECCGLEEECTQEYIKKTKDCYSGKWVCGLCSEAVKEALVREPNKAIEEALRNQKEFCQEFHSSRLNPELSLTCAMRKIAKKSCHAFGQLKDCRFHFASALMDDRTLNPLKFVSGSQKRLFNTRFPHPPPTPPLTLPMLKDKEPPLAAVGPSADDHRHPPITTME
ncbi:hypothetical protein RHSIM_RhsimUnG0222800 [Rhododendron simsii]|uniref:DUF1677 family protein n=1 Tax=Rhododendron simsii TaxID=118357 RepID=A0A834L234_RHOSS|nr:hypothetical protein RHSIM_RhsimUnG0222800 [Rhododendron simsii]